MPPHVDNRRSNLADTNSPRGVFGIGWIVHDAVRLVPQYPVEDTKTEAIGDLEQVGGPVARALSAVASLNRGASISATVGDDESGLVCRETLEGRGVNTSYIQIREGGRTRRSHVWISALNASRTNVYSNSALAPLANAEDIMAAAERFKILHLDGRELQIAIPVAAHMRDSGKTVVVDAGGWKPNLESLLEYTDIVIVSLRTLKLTDGRDLTASASDLLNRFALRGVVVTGGEQGAWVADTAGLTHVDALPIKRVDTHGAGDVFAGGLIYGLLDDLSLVDSVRFGSGLAALSCEHFGDFFASAEQVSALLSKGTELAQPPLERKWQIAV